MNNIACLVEYDGSGFYGFQKQNEVRTIQTELEKALSQFTNQKIAVTCAGRTDTGVHATGQVINFITNTNRPLSGYTRGVNALLPKDITIIKAVSVPDNFHARFNAISRTYNYYLYNWPTRPAILNSKVGWYHGELEIPAIKKACAMLVGEHNFSTFRASQCQANNPVKIMHQCEVEISPLHPKILCFKFCANSFLHHMIRNIIGSMVYIGNGKLSINQFKELINSKNRVYAPPTFMADGLYFTQANYPSEVLDFNSSLEKFLI
ncbi:MAG: tRNA pseudouridine(38-40) synthase TruA [Burkholderiales bacterium]|nr:tRNA pseudouridine(38-40) synthase TruA [Burkholderiales bacterium]